MFRSLKKILVACLNSVTDLYRKRHLTNACSLAYTTLLSIIPLFSVIIYAGSLSHYFSKLSELARHYATSNLLPSTNSKVIGYLDTLSHQANRLPTISLIFLLITAIILIRAIDTTMNMVWQNYAQKRKLLNLLFYFLGVFAIPLIIALGSLLSTWIAFMFDTLPFMRVAKLIIPLVINSFLLSILYYMTARGSLRFKNILLGGFIASLALQLIKILFAVYITRFSNYQTLYGALSIIPVFLIWLFIFWATIIYGALVARNS